MNFHNKPTIYVGHVTLKVSDLQQSLDFYKNKIGFNVLSQTKDKAELTADGATVLLTLVQPKDVSQKEPKRTGLYHLALLLPEKQDLANLLVHLSQAGIDLGAADHLVSEALYFSDPDGHGIEVYIDRDPSEWTWNAGRVLMTTDPLNVDELMSYRKENDAWSGLPKTTKLGHIHLHVANLNETRTFYVEGLGLEVVSAFGQQAIFLSDGQYHHHIGVNTWQGEGALPEKETSVGLQSFTMIFNDKETRDAAIMRLDRQKAPIETTNDKITVKDPSGNWIELTY